METIFIRLEHPPKGKNHATSIEGRAAAKNWDKLTTAAKEINARPLQDFLRNSSESWYSPNDAINSIRKLVSRIASNKTHFENARLLLRDLSSYENILSAAAARGSRFQFTPTVPEEGNS